MLKLLFAIAVATTFNYSTPSYAQQVVHRIECNGGTCSYVTYMWVNGAWVRQHGIVCSSPACEGIRPRPPSLQ